MTSKTLVVPRHQWTAETTKAWLQQRRRMDARAGRAMVAYAKQRWSEVD